MAQMMFLSPNRSIAHFVMRTAAPVFSNTVPIAHPRKITIATLLMVPEKPPLMVLSISCHGVFNAMARTSAAIRIPNAAFTLHFEIKKIINAIAITKTMKLCLLFL